MFEQLETWHVLFAFAAFVFIGWAINRNREVKTEAQELIEEQARIHDELVKKMTVGVEEDIVVAGEKKGFLARIINRFKAK